ncbi:putative Ribonuclease [Hypsibius exemplaris]|uniref:Ribonuclease n=1 Tax=Hypsibius exemplaris TaxID=2072580 RepID=A0A1W0WT50_HYPEX|nr:putative Ribonuclease [Hypsibius exemplaris]
MSHPSASTPAPGSVLRRVITSPEFPAPIAPYSPAIQAGQTLYISGQLGVNPATGELVEGGVAKEAEQALINLGALLRVAGVDYANVVKVTVLLADINDFQTVNQIYAKYFPRDPPARVAYQVGALPKGGRIEIEATAVVGNIRTE